MCFQFLRVAISDIMDCDTLYRLASLFWLTVFTNSRISNTCSEVSLDIP